MKGIALLLNRSKSIGLGDLYINKLTYVCMQIHICAYAYIMI